MIDKKNFFFNLLGAAINPIHSSKWHICIFSILNFGEFYQCPLFFHKVWNKSLRIFFFSHNVEIQKRQNYSELKASCWKEN
jgi:hypothetical protein